MNSDLSVLGSSTTLLVIIGVLVGIVLMGLIAAILFWRGRRADEAQPPPVNISQALADIESLKAVNKYLFEQVAETERKYREAEEKRREALTTVQRLTDKVKVLTDQLEAKNLITPFEEPKQLCVLGIWTTAPGLDPQANAEALAVAGVEYTELSGARASMEAITYALPLRDYTIIEIGAEGDVNGIKLADGLATTQWWVDIARIFKISTFILLADSSGVQDALSIADRLYNTPTVRAVISVDGRVEDVVARRFARRFYAALGQGQTMSDAFALAKVAVGAQNGRLFRLREKSASGD